MGFLGVKRVCPCLSVSVRVFLCLCLSVSTSVFVFGVCVLLCALCCSRVCALLVCWCARGQACLCLSACVCVCVCVPPPPLLLFGGVTLSPVSFGPFLEWAGSARAPQAEYLAQRTGGMCRLDPYPAGKTGKIQVV